MDLVLFGRSPFINRIDVIEIARRYKTVGLNHFGESYGVDYLFYFDRFIENWKGTPELFIPAWFPQYCPGKRYRTQVSDGPIFPAQSDPMILGHKYFTASLAINWAILQGFKTIYLVGIDHVETDKAFQHFDNIDHPVNLTAKAHECFKNYVYNGNKYVKIIQTNPAVKDAWDLDFINFEALYGTSAKKAS